MNRIHLTVASCLVAFGHLGFGDSPVRAQDQYMSRPTYVVAARSSVGGDTVTPTSAPAYNAPRYFAAPRFFAPAQTYRTVVPRASAWNYDPSGRHDNLARPWLRSSR